MFRRKRLGPSVGARQAPDLVELGIQLRKQYEHTGNDGALELSIRALESILPSTLEGDAYRLAALTALGLSLQERYERSGSSADLTRAVALHEEAAAVVPQDSPHVAGVLSNLAGSLRLRYNRDGHAEDLTRAVDAYRRAIEVTPPGSRWRPLLLNIHCDLAGALGDRYLLTGDLADGAAAVAAAERAVTEASGMAGEARYRTARYRTALSVALGRLYAGTGQLEHLDRAIAEQQAAIERSSEGAIELPAWLNNLAGSLNLRHRVTGEPGDLDQAIEIYQAAVSLQTEDKTDAALLYGNLGSSHLQRYDETGAPDDLDTAIALLERAVAAAERLGSAEQVLRENSRLAGALASRYKRDRRLEDLNRAVAGHERAATGLPAGINEQLTSLLSFAADLTHRHDLQGEAADRERASDAFRRGCRAALERGPELALRGARNWGNFAAGLGAWSDAAEAGRLALDATRRLFVAQALRPHREAWLGTAQGLPAKTAYALAKIGDLDGAVVAVEQGQALLLSEALDHERVRLDELAEIGHQDLVERYRAAAARVNQLEREELDRPTAVPPERHADTLRRARQELTVVVEAIQAVPGQAEFLRTGDLDDITAVAVAAPLLYLLAHPMGGLALVVRQGVPTTAVWLPELTVETFWHQFVAFSKAFGSSDQADVPQALDRLTTWLWQAAIDPLLDVLPAGGEVRVVPVGPLVLLPLHAAWTHDPASHDRRRYALDTMTFMYAPNARAFRAASERVGARRPERLLAVGEPQPVQAADLPHATAEARAVRRFFPRGRLLVGWEATKDRVLSSMSEQDVLHLACHSQANIRAPLASALLLAGDDPLTLRELLGHRLARIRLAVLSACETAVPGLVLPDEAIGFPAGLLQAGTAGVVSSQWQVADASTMALMERFYEFWRGDGLNPAEALRQAQLWVRHITNREREQYFPGVVEFVGPDDSEAKRAFWADGRSWTHPYHWAAFTYTGS
jgi:CHAT domain-containing protein